MKNKQSFIYILFFLFSVNTYSQLGTDDETITTTIEFETTNFHASFYQGGQNSTPISSYKGNTYFVYVNSALRPVIGKIDNTGKTTTEFLDKNTEDLYHVTKDGHHRFSLGIDKKGYIHIIGDLHNYGAETTINYIDRYNRFSEENPNGSHILYWVSKKPEDISSFEFRGADLEKKIPGNGFSYPAFYSDMNGELYVRHRGRVSIAGHYDGEMALVVAKYDVNTKTWSEIGGKAPNNSFPNDNYKTLYDAVFWENNGVPNSWQHAPKGRHWYQGFHGDLMRFDFNNRLHITTAINNNFDQVQQMTDILYAYSDDGGITFNKADGTNVNQLPVRAEEGPNQGSIVAGESESLDGYWSCPSVCADKDGSPIITYTKVNPENTYGYHLGTYKYWDKKNNEWTEEKANPICGYIRQTNILDANGIITFIGPDQNGLLIREFGLTPSVKFKNITRLNGFFTGIDQRGIREKNVIRGFYYDRSQEIKTLKIIAIEGKPKPTALIPDEWTSTSIGGATGESNMYHDIYQLKSTGNFGKELSCKYINRSIKGDFEFQARVINVNYITDSSFAGLMIRDQNKENSLFFGVAATSYQGVKTISQDSEEFKSSESTGYEPSEWLKITKEGNSLTSYRSDNGENWVLLDKKTINMPDTVYIGLISGSGNSEEGHARIDNVTINDKRIVAHYPFDNSTLDISGNDLHGMENDTFNYTIDGKNQSLILNRTSDYVRIPSNNLLTPENFTVSAWIKPSNIIGIKGIIKSANSDGATSGWRLIMNTTNVVARVNTDQEFGKIQSSGLIINEWNHVALTYDNNEIKIYINKEFSRSSPLSGNILYPRKSFVEIGHSSGVNNFEGQIDEIKIYNQALDQNSIADNYDQEKQYFSSSFSAKNWSSELNIDTKTQNNIVISFYFNFNNKAINITYPHFIGDENLQITNISGEIIIDKKLDGINSTIDISNLKSSMYFLKIDNSNGRVVLKKILI